MKSVRVYAPATISNVGPGFDIMGFAIDQPGDIVKVTLNEDEEIRLINKTQVELPLDPDKNVSSVAVKAFLNTLDIKKGFEITFEQKINPGSGIGSSAASAAAAVYGVNKLLGDLLSKEELVRFVMQGEKISSGSAHADNAAPCMLGGFVLIRSYEPLDLIPLPCPESLFCTVVHPEIEIRTEFSRSILRREIRLTDAVKQCGNTAGLIIGLFRSDYDLIGRSLVDVFAEPRRSVLIPGFSEVKKRVSAAGALGSSISGSGPSIFALTIDFQTATSVAQAMQSVFKELEIDSKVFVSSVNREGTIILD